MEFDNKTPVKEGQYIWLDEPEKTLHIFNTKVEIYAVDLAENSANRVYIASLGPNEAFAGVQVRQFNIRILALAVKDGEVAFCDRNSIFSPADCPDKLNKILNIFLSWSPNPAPNQYNYKEYVYGETLEFFQHETLAPNHSSDIIWAELLAGEISLEGVSPRNIELGEIVPLSSATWLKAQSSSQARVYSTEEILSFLPKEKIALIFQKEQELFLKRIREHFIVLKKRLLEKIDQKNVHNQVMLSQALSELIRNDIPDLGQLPLMQTSASALLRAMRLIAANFKIPEQKIKLPPDLPLNLPDKDIIKYVSKNANMVSRLVRLEKGWHRQDQGPLLVFKDGCPLAVLPKNRTEYVLIDPVSFTRTVLDENTASAISEDAYTFYKCLPARPVTLGEYLKHSVEFCFARDFWILLFACLTAGFIPIVTPLITQTIFEDIIPNFDKQAHLIVVQVMFVTAASAALISLTRSIVFIRIKNKIHLFAESSLWIKLLSLPPSFFRAYQIGDLAMRMQSINRVCKELSGMVSSGIFNGIFSFWNLAVMFYYNRRMTLAAVFVWFIYFAVCVYFSWRLAKFQRKRAQSSSELSSRTLQLLSGLSKFRVRAAEDRAFYLWANKFGQDWKWNRACRRQANWQALISQAHSLILTMLIFYLCIYWMDLSIKDNIAFISHADFIAFNAALGSFGSCISGLIPSITTLFSLAPLIERLKPILAEEPETSENKIEIGRITGKVEITNVNFRYNSNMPLVLKSISFNISPGEFLAIVGASGSGKSTLLRLILGLEKPERGSVQYDGQNISEVDITSLRRQLGVVMQEGRLMSGSIFDNIIGSLPLTRQDAMEAARMVGLDNDLKEMPMGIDTVISEGAGNISGGQRQRILIARCLVNRPRIIVFDEATSALDNHTQAIVASTLENLKATRIVVAHRLSTIQKADRIIVLDKGSIVEDGSYSELMDKNGYFAELSSRQI